GIEPGQIMILTHGRLAPEKGIEDLLAAVDVLKQDWPDRLVVLIAGDGPLRPALEKIVKERRLEGEGRVIGFQAAIPPLLAATDMVVLPTWREGLSIALLEAMSLGTAIVTTSIGSNREATCEGEGALLVPAGRPGELARAIHMLASSGGLRNALG